MRIYWRSCPGRGNRKEAKKIQALTGCFGAKNEERRMYNLSHNQEKRLETEIPKSQGPMDPDHQWQGQENDCRTAVVAPFTALGCRESKQSNDKSQKE